MGACKYGVFMQSINVFIANYQFYLNLLKQVSNIPNPSIKEEITNYIQSQFFQQVKYNTKRITEYYFKLQILEKKRINYDTMLIRQLVNNREYQKISQLLNSIKSRQNKFLNTTPPYLEARVKTLEELFTYFKLYKRVFQRQMDLIWDKQEHKQSFYMIKHIHKTKKQQFRERQHKCLQMLGKFTLNNLRQTRNQYLLININLHYCRIPFCDTKRAIKTILEVVQEQCIKKNKQAKLQLVVGNGEHSEQNQLKLPQQIIRSMKWYQFEFNQNMQFEHVLKRPFFIVTLKFNKDNERVLRKNSDVQSTESDKTG